MAVIHSSVMFDPEGTNTQKHFPGGKSHASCPAARPPSANLFLYTHRAIDGVRKTSPTASTSHYPTLSRYFSCISDQSLILSNTDTGQTLLAEARWTVSVKREQCFLRNHHLTNEGWWSSSCRGRTICKDGAQFVWAATPSGPITKPTRIPLKLSTWWM